MRRAAFIFLAAIFLPCLVLAWLAVRSEQDQQVILQHQQAIIDQGVADSLAQNVRAQMDSVIADFVATTRQLEAKAGSPGKLADGFDQGMREAWPLAQVGFAVDMEGTLFSPRRSDPPPAQTFRRQNESFLINREDAEVYSNSQAKQFVMRDIKTQNFAKLAVVTAGENQNSLAVRAPVARHDMPVDGASVDLKSTAGISSNLKKEQVPADELKIHGAQGSANYASGISLAPVLRAEKQRQIEPPAASAAVPGSAPVTPATVNVAPSASTDEVSDTMSINSVKSTNSEVEGTADVAVAGSGQAAVNSTPERTTSTPSVPIAQLAQTKAERIERQVAPMENSRAADAVLSNVLPAQSDFRQLIGQSSSGAVARFLEDKLCLLVWSAPPHGSIIFGAQLDQDKLVDKLRDIVQPEANRSTLDSSFGGRANYCLALLDDKGRPVALSQPGFSTDWKHPFVATEIGGVLPHWEAALYLLDPGAVSHSARTLHYTVGLIIVLLIVAILAGGTLIGADIRRQLRLAQQKTDFVSNVSHELKTPLTSIRMFADMLAEDRVQDGEKQSAYLRIISAESARLTRLINNVLDFARMEQGAPVGERHLCDLTEVARDVTETCRPHLESAKIALGLDVEAEPLMLTADRDALAQIVLNLISNAEKYGGGEILVRVRLQKSPDPVIGCVDVFDRGPGIPPKNVETIFAPFQRLDDSLASGVPGSGLGLTLARRMARAHGGDVTYQARVGGGSCFTLSLPLAPKKSSV